MKHTRGPWRVITRDRTSKPDRFGRTIETHEIFINGADGLGSIAKLYVGHDSDARLIAAAPEQHDLLIEALDLVPRISEDDPIAPALAEWCRKARAAIVKAKGAA